MLNNSNEKPHFHRHSQHPMNVIRITEMCFNELVICYRWHFEPTETLHTKNNPFQALLSKEQGFTWLQWESREGGLTFSASLKILGSFDFPLVAALVLLSLLSGQAGETQFVPSPSCRQIPLNEWISILYWYLPLYCLVLPWHTIAVSAPAINLFNCFV